MLTTSQTNSSFPSYETRPFNIVSDTFCDIFSQISSIQRLFSASRTKTHTKINKMAEESKMEEQLKKPTRIIVPDLSLSESKATSRSIPSSPVGLRKAASIRSNCLCSPTTHAGSFRCRYHRNSSSGLTRSSMSVGSKLSELVADKSNSICDNLRKQIIAGHHNQGS